MTAKPIFIKGTGCRSGGCVRKAVELNSGDLPFVRHSGLGVEVSGLQLHTIRTAEAAHCAKGGGSFQAASSGIDEPDQKRKHGTDG